MNGDCIHAKTSLFSHSNTLVVTYLQAAKEHSLVRLKVFLVLNWLRQAWLALSGSKRCDEIVKFS